MKTTFTKIALAVFGLAMIFTISCLNRPPCMYEAGGCGKHHRYSSSAESSSSSLFVELSSSSLLSSSSFTIPSSSSLITYTIIYDANGGTGAPTSQTKIHDVPLKLSGAKPTRIGYTFVIWNTEANGSGTSYAPESNYTNDASVTLYAQWKANTYIVKYDANGGTNVTIPADQTKIHDVPLTLNNTIPTRLDKGYTFVIWNTEVNGSGTSYVPGAIYTNNANVTLYAQWKCKTDNGPSVEYGGETYESVIICSQTWLKRNLNYNVENSLCYNSNNSKCAIYGRLYNWATAMALSSNCNSTICVSQVSDKHNKGICPSGWHIPSAKEWSTLVSNVERSQDCTNCAGKHLKATNEWKDCSVETKSCLDSYGFSALPGGGESGITSSFSGNTIGMDGVWWSATELSGSDASLWRTRYNSEFFKEGLSGNGDKKLNLFSVRCLKD